MSWLRNIVMLAMYAGGLSWSAYELQTPPPAVTDQADDTATDEYEIAQPVRPFKLTINQFDAIVQRPLFNPDRSPLTDSSEPEAETPTARSRLTAADISGLRVSAIFKDAESIAALIELKRNESKLVHSGDQVGAWEVLEILDDRVILEQNGEQKVFLVQEFEQPPVTTAKPSNKSRTRHRRLRRSLPVKRTTR